MPESHPPPPDTVEAEHPERLPEPREPAPVAAEPPIVVTRPRSHLPWAFALVFLAVIASATFLAWHFLPSFRVAQQDMAEAAGSGGEAAARVYDDLKAGAAAVGATVHAVAAPEVKIETVISNAVGRLSSQSKLVVLTRTFPVQVEKRASYKLWDLLELDGSVVHLRVSNNSVQYHVPLHRVTADDFTYSEADRTLRVTLPEPRLDPAMIVVAPDPDDWVVDADISAGRIHDWWGEALLEEARREVQTLVVQAAREELVVKEAREQAYDQLAALIRAIAAPFAPDLDIQVEFRREFDPMQGGDAWPTHSASLS